MVQTLFVTEPSTAEAIVADELAQLADVEAIVAHGAAQPDTDSSTAGDNRDAERN